MKGRKLQWAQDLYVGQMVIFRTMDTTVRFGRIMFWDGYIGIANNHFGEFAWEFFGFKQFKIIGYDGFDSEDDQEEPYIELNDFDVDWIYEHKKSEELVWKKKKKLN